MEFINAVCKHFPGVNMIDPQKNLFVQSGVLLNRHTISTFPAHGNQHSGANQSHYAEARHGKVNRNGRLLYGIHNCAYWPASWRRDDRLCSSTNFLGQCLPWKSDPVPRYLSHVDGRWNRKHCCCPSRCGSRTIICCVLLLPAWSGCPDAQVNKRRCELVSSNQVAQMVHSSAKSDTITNQFVQHPRLHKKSRQ